MNFIGDPSVIGGFAYEFFSRNAKVRSKTIHRFLSFAFRIADFGAINLNVQANVLLMSRLC
jgi:hypothetical protein